jgi:hypothetical protein
MILYVKIGTHSARRMKLFRKRKAPKVGDIFKLRELNHERYDKPIGVYCHEVRDVGGEPLYILERM